MSKNRLEAFSDGVIAIIITIMVLELRTPEGADIKALLGFKHNFLSYALSFVFIGIYWNNHHHLLQVVTKVNGRILWANLHLLFWLSLIPLSTNWMGDSNFAELPVAFYGSILWLAGLAYYLLTLTLLAEHGKESALAAALRSQVKEYISLGTYTLAIPLAFINTNVTLALYVAVALIWLIPDRRIESRLKK